LLLHSFRFLGSLKFLSERFPLSQGAIQILDHLLKLLHIPFVPQTAILKQGDLTVIPVFGPFKHSVELWSFILFAKVDFLLVVILLVKETLEPQVYFVCLFTLLIGFFFAVYNHLGDFAVSRLYLSHFFQAILDNLMTRLL
jgi:hypothetical protein